MEQGFKQWAILELMGHRRLAGEITDATIGGGAFLRIDIPGRDGKATSTQFYSPASVYCITPTTEEIARGVAVQSQPEPVHAWELPKPPALTEARWELCSFRRTCAKAVRCLDCEIYAQAMQDENRGSAAGEELEDEP
jgi:hypothetical protein